MRRRGRLLLGTLVEIGVVLDTGIRAGTGAADSALDTAFSRIAQIESSLTRFDPQSEIGRFNDAPAGAVIGIGADAEVVLTAAARLCAASDALFDISLGTGADAWSCRGRTLHKHRTAVRLDLGGIAKGHAVDAAVATLQAHGASAGWVNAGGDLRVFGALTLPIELRDERTGGVRPFALLEDGAFATSRLAPMTGGEVDSACNPRHASVACAECLWADALTKVVVRSGDAQHAALAAHGARAWLH